jgi:N-acetylmuramic acid 6-phosphate etherase
VALVSLLGEVPAARATVVLEEADGGVREALQRLRTA